MDDRTAWVDRLVDEFEATPIEAKAAWIQERLRTTQLELEADGSLPALDDFAALWRMVFATLEARGGFGADARTARPARALADAALELAVAHLRRQLEGQR